MEDDGPMLNETPAAKRARKMNSRMVELTIRVVSHAPLSTFKPEHLQLEHVQSGGPLVVLRVVAVKALKA